VKTAVVEKPGGSTVPARSLATSAGLIGPAGAPSDSVGTIAATATAPAPTRPMPCWAAIGLGVLRFLFMLGRPPGAVAARR
jgi:hypothetical protein